MATTYSSVHMRERDKILEEKHQKELHALERKVERLKRANDDTLKQLYDAQARALRLANSLGFKDLPEAQVYIDTADDDIPYKECFDQVSTLKVQVESATVEADRLRERLEHANKEKGELGGTLAALQEKELDDRKSSELQLSALQKRYDELRDTYERATEKYLFDYKKWESFNAWLNSDDTKDENTGVISKKQHNANVMSKKRKVREMENDRGLSAKEKGYPPLGDITNPFLMDKENQVTLTSARVIPRSSRVRNSARSPPSSASFKRNSTTPNLNRTLKYLPSSRPFDPAETGMANMPLCSPSVFLDSSSPTATAREFFTFKPMSSPISDAKQQSDPTPSKAVMNRTNKHTLPDNIIPSSSDTEEDTQSVTADFGPASSKTEAPLITLAQSSDTEEDTQPLSLDNFLPTPKTLPRSSIIKYKTTTKEANACPEPPRKLRRVDAINVTSTPVGCSSRTVLNSNALLTPADINLSDRQPDKGNQKISNKQSTGEKVDKENQLVSTPANNTKEQSSLPDYSAFKGRGRYTNLPTKTLNGQYEINSRRNDGLGYQYDEVVRCKEDRKKMEAADCECCRDYYEAVGPLPPRLQPPLWRSPPKTEVKRKATNCVAHKRHVSDTHAMAAGGLVSAADVDEHASQFGTVDDGWNDKVEDHKKAISRHRHHWARASTPPGYWDIGFPDTQEATKINAKAKEMHRKKQDEVERSIIRGDGKYRRRS